MVKGTPVVFQNAQADIPILEKYLSIHYEDYCRIDDLMLAHGVLWSEWPHDLEFLASVYSTYPKTKHLAKTDPLLYNRGDVADTVRAWAAVQSELHADPPSQAVYWGQSLPLVPILLRRQAVGIKTNQPIIEEAVALLKTEQEAATRLARLYTGVPGFSLGSPAQLARWLYDIEGLPVQIHKVTKRRTIDDEAMVVLRELHDPIPDFEEEQTAPLTYADAVDRVASGAHPLLEARVIYAGAQQALSHYLRPMLGRGRIYPHYALHAQASGRWSITNPPAPTVPAPDDADRQVDPGRFRARSRRGVDRVGLEAAMEPRLEAYQSRRAGPDRDLRDGRRPLHPLRPTDGMGGPDG